MRGRVQALAPASLGPDRLRARPRPARHRPVRARIGQPACSRTARRSRCPARPTIRRRSNCPTARATCWCISRCRSARPARWRSPTAPPRAATRARPFEAYDTHSASPQPAELQVGRLRLRYLLETDERTGYLCIGLARVTEVTRRSPHRAGRSLDPAGAGLFRGAAAVRPDRRAVRHAEPARRGAGGAHDRAGPGAASRRSPTSCCCNRSTAGRTCWRTGRTRRTSIRSRCTPPWCRWRASSRPSLETRRPNRLSGVSARRSAAQLRAGGRRSAARAVGGAGADRDRDPAARGAPWRAGRADHRPLDPAGVELRADGAGRRADRAVAAAVPVAGQDRRGRAHPRAGECGACRASRCGRCRSRRGSCRSTPARPISSWTAPVRTGSRCRTPAASRSTSPAISPICGWNSGRSADDGGVRRHERQSLLRTGRLRPDGHPPGARRPARRTAAAGARQRRRSASHRRPQARRADAGGGRGQDQLRPQPADRGRRAAAAAARPPAQHLQPARPRRPARARHPADPRLRAGGARRRRAAGPASPGALRAVRQPRRRGAEHALGQQRRLGGALAGLDLPSGGPQRRALLRRARASCGRIRARSCRCSS